jgi:cation diffusion facilitator family transporter
MSASGGSRAVIAALAANLGIAVSKLVGFAVTGSSSMLAESVHSLADSGNQGLLLLGRKRSQRAPDARHQFGHGAERYFYAFIVSLTLFTVGAMFAVYEGVEKIRHPHHLESAIVAIVILGVAILLEGISFRTAIGESRELKGEQSWVSFIRTSRVPELPVVLLEDLAALIGLVIAFAAVVTSQATHDPIYDGVGTLLIGILLGIVAVILGVETKSLLIGESARPGQDAEIRAAFESSPHVTRVIHLRTLHLGPDELLVGAKLEFDRGLDMAALATAIDQAEARVRAAVSLVTTMYVEPDLYRESAS